MTDIKGFMVTLITAAAASALLGGFLPSTGMKTLVKYLISLTVLVMLISPLVNVIKKLPDMADADIPFAYEYTDAYTRANSIVALRIERSLCEKFGIDEGNIDVKYDGNGINVRLMPKMGLFKSDISLYIKNNFGVESEVSFYE